VPGLPLGLERLILRLMAKSASQRYQTYEALLVDLRLLTEQ